MFEVKGNKKIGNQLGRLGEDIACKFLQNKGFLILSRNYQKKFGEIDIICRNNEEIHFIEVKTVSRENNYLGVTHETDYNMENDIFRAEDNVHPWKLRRLKNTILAYLEEKKISCETLWHFDVLILKINPLSKKVVIKMISDVIL